MTGSKRLSIILLSYNDPRVLRAIESIRNFDDINTVKIIVIDGGSSEEIRQNIQDALSSHDTLVSEPDKGIFDALNKGLDLCETEYIGWLGSDDMFTGAVLASQVVGALEQNDIFVANLYYFHNGYVTRIVHSMPSRLGLVKYGLNNPHFATFGTATLFKSERFELTMRGSDIDYFIKLFNKKPNIATTNAVATLQEEGGFSNTSYMGVLHTNVELTALHAHYTNWLLAPVIVFLKLVFKVSLKVYYRVFKRPVVYFNGIESSDS